MGFSGLRLRYVHGSANYSSRKEPYLTKIQVSFVRISGIKTG